MAKVKDVTSLEVLNSRGDWTIKTFLELEGGHKGWAIVPEGASKGEKEALCVDATNAVKNVSEKIASKIVGKDFKSQRDFDDYLCLLDGTKNKANLGANTILSLSCAFSRAATSFYNLELWGYLRHEFLYAFEGKSPDPFLKVSPTPLFNILNGGKHARNGLSFQEFMVIPSKKYNFRESLEVGRNIYKKLKSKLESEGLSTAVGDEGGFAPSGFNVRKALTYIRESAGKDFKIGEDVFLGMDVAADSFFDGTSYLISEENLKLSGKDLIGYYLSLIKEFELIYLEDPFAENDIESWRHVKEVFGNKLMICADDLVVTNQELLGLAISEQLANSVIVKPNQIGTVWETLCFVAKARQANWSIVVSHRSGDTEDTFIADLAYAVGADFVKFGSPVRGERTCKFNRMLELK